MYVETVHVDQPHARHLDEIVDGLATVGEAAGDHDPPGQAAFG